MDFCTLALDSVCFSFLLLVANRLRSRVEGYRIAQIVPATAFPFCAILAPARRNGFARAFSHEGERATCPDVAVFSEVVMGTSVNALANAICVRPETARHDTAFF